MQSRPAGSFVSDAEFQAALRQQYHSLQLKYRSTDALDRVQAGLERSLKSLGIRDVPSTSQESPPSTSKRHLMDNKCLESGGSEQTVSQYCNQCASNLLSSARHPEYADITMRINSFSNSTWTSNSVKDQTELAEAGFYYTGREDRVRCFFCNGGLCNFDRDDIVWYEHARWFGNCSYLLECRKHPVISAVIQTAQQIKESANVPDHAHTSHGYTQCDGL